MIPIPTPITVQPIAMNTSAAYPWYAIGLVCVVVLALTYVAERRCPEWFR